MKRGEGGPTREGESSTGRRTNCIILFDVHDYPAGGEGTQTWDWVTFCDGMDPGRREGRRRAPRRKESSSEEEKSERVTNPKESSGKEVRNFVCVEKTGVKGESRLRVKGDKSEGRKTRTPTEKWSRVLREGLRRSTQAARDTRSTYVGRVGRNHV